MYEKSSTVAFGVTRSRFSIPITRDRISAAYEGAKKEMLSTINGRLLNEKKIEILGRESRRYVVALPGGALVGEVCAVIIGNELFTFIHIHPKEAADSGAAPFFAKISDGKNG
jgi:hypothetical protein